MWIIKSPAERQGNKLYGARLTFQHVFRTWLNFTPLLASSRWVCTDPCRYLLHYQSGFILCMRFFLIHLFSPRIFLTFHITNHLSFSLSCPQFDSSEKWQGPSAVIRWDWRKAHGLLKKTRSSWLTSKSMVMEAGEPCLPKLVIYINKPFFFFLIMSWLDRCHGTFLLNDIFIVISFFCSMVDILQGSKDVGRAVDSGGLTISGQISREESSVCRKSKQSFNCMLFLETGEIAVPPGDT